MHAAGNEQRVRVAHGTCDAGADLRNKPFPTATDEARRFNEDPDFRGSRERLFRTIWHQMQIDMWSGRTIEYRGSLRPMLAVPMHKLRETAYRQAHEIAREGTIRHYGPNRDEAKRRAGEAL